MSKLLKIIIVGSALMTLTACTGHIENKKSNCSYDYLLHPAISLSKVIGGCGPAVDAK
ncbi:TPA: YhfL family protein [Salmonella enterica]|nr:YhfL family protein [Salmonella enterica]HCT3092782.1 YhfL family protein [Salmonella enterica subsp. diarizonae serovar 61:l,v:z35]HCT3102777.1 YhfL family protein [Salmonella enterica subsp. diarizonae serovar 61:l,v:z35]